MTKPAIARLFFGSLVAIIAGVLVLCLAAVWLGHVCGAAINR